MIRWLNSTCLITILTALLLVSCEGQQEIVQSLSEYEANEILVALNSQKILATKTQIPGREITFSISVKDAQVAAALKILVDNKLPRQKERGFSIIYPPGKGGLIPTQNEEKARFLMGSQGEIENMLEALPGVVKAQVAIVLPDNSVLRDISTPTPRAKASVAVIYNPPMPDQPLPVSKEDIQQLVSSAVMDLAPVDVTVILSANQPLVLVDDTTSRIASKDYTSSSIVADLAALEKATNAQLNPELKRTLLTYLENQQEEVEKAHFLIWIFAALAFLGLALGIFGLVRRARAI